MTKKHDEQIEEKLRELEVSMKEATSSNVPASIQKSTGLSARTTHISAGKDAGKDRQEPEGGAVKADLHLLGGTALLLVGVFVLFSHLTVTTAQSMFWGGFGGATGTGGLILLLLVGLGFFFYDYKNKIGWLLVACSLAAIVFSLFATMRIILMPMDLLSLIFLFLPLVIGSALLAKGIMIHSRICNRHSADDK